MGLAFHHGLVGSETVRVRRQPAVSATRGLSDDVAFLRDYQVDEDALRATSRNARRSGVTAAAALVAEGDVSETLFLYSLSRHLGLRFEWAWPRLCRSANASKALRTGQVNLADGTLLVAPTGHTLRLLLKARRRGHVGPDRLAITTPAHLAALVCKHLPEQIVRSAARTFAEAAPDLSARGVLREPAALLCCACVLGGLVGLLMGARLVVDLAGATFFAALIFRLLVSAAGLPESASQPGEIDDVHAPTYSVLVPLFKEAAMVPGLVAALKALDYPRAKLDILFLTESDDAATRLALFAAGLPSHMRVFVVPDGEPRTKPRALNAGLLASRGDIVTVYDAEDRPHPGQLRQAAWRFVQGPRDLACLQARLAISNGASGILPRLFAIEYAALFDIYNVGAMRLGLPIALGGTSNHFRREALNRVGGWDAFNVTEDADLGLRLARFGYGVEDLPSTTRERAELGIVAWFNQRRRWTKGWIQTALVLCRDTGAARDLGFARSVAVALILVNLVVGPLVSPVAIAALVCHVISSGLPHPQTLIEACEATLVVSVLTLGIASPIWCGYTGVRARGLPLSVPSLLLMLPYQLLICCAAWGGLLDLVVRPHHWRKTPHTAGPEAGSSVVHRPERGRRREGRAGDGGEAEGAEHEKWRGERHRIAEPRRRGRHAEDENGHAQRQDQDGHQQPAFA